MRSINKSSVAVAVAVAVSSVARLRAASATSRAASTLIGRDPADRDEQLRQQDLLQLQTPPPSRPDTAGVTAAVPSRGLAGGRARRMLTAVALVAGLCGGAMAIDTATALSAVSAGPVCEGYNQSNPPYPLCTVAPYTTHNYQNESSSS